jgi:hypothetical protein
VQWIVGVPWILCGPEMADAAAVIDSPVPAVGGTKCDQIALRHRVNHTPIAYFPMPNISELCWASPNAEITSERLTSNGATHIQASEVLSTVPNKRICKYEPI